MTPLTIAELELRRAQLAERAERLRAQWRATPSVSPRALAMGKAVTALQERADEYAAILRVAREMT